MIHYIIFISVLKIIFLFFFCLAASCTKIPFPDDGEASALIQDRIGHYAPWYQGHPKESIQCLIDKELTADSAIQIALLNNPKIQATFEELGISQANLVEAGLLSNPSFEVEVRYPHLKGLTTNIEYLITSSLLDIFLIPLRTRLAATDFEQTKLKVSHEILDLAFEVRETYYKLILERKKSAYIQSIVELTSILSEISSKQRGVGNINTLQFQLSQSKSLEAKLELLQSQAEIISLREKLHRLLGFAEDICLLLPEMLPEEIEWQGFDLCILEAIALEKRLDLQVARFEIIRLRQLLGLKEGWTYTNLKGGLAGEQEPDGANLLGFGISGEIPIFNYGQAARLRLFASLRQAENLLAELEIRVLSEVQEAHQLLMSYLLILHDYKNNLLPMQEEILISSEKLYNVMGLGIDTLLENKRQEVIINQNYIEALKKYLVARVALDRALGGILR